VQGRLKQRQYETREGEKRTVIELDVEEVGPSLKYATAKVTRVTRGGGGGGGGFGGGGDDPWASQPAAPQQGGAPQGAAAASGQGSWGGQQGGGAAPQGGGAPQGGQDPWAVPGGTEEPPF
jgi:single-strand DNA-binding protein